MPSWSRSTSSPSSIASFPEALAARHRERTRPFAPLDPLVLELDDGCWTLAFAGNEAVVRPGTPEGDPVRLRLTPALLEDLALDQITPIGMMTGGTLDLAGTGNALARALDWWIVLRDALDEDPLPGPDEVEVASDLTRSFTLDDDPAEIRAFLEDAGFVHLRGVFTAEEMARISADMDTAAEAYAPGDGRSWWAGTASGERLVRMQFFEDHSPTAAALLDDPRFTMLGDIPGCGHRFGGFAESRWEALFKPIGVTAGISDVPWHKDCSLGRHSYECMRVTVGVSVTGAGPTTGQLRVVPGSHRALMWPSLIDVSTLPLPDIGLATETGDVTLHLSCTLHMAQPPTTAERRVLYTSFTLPPVDPEAQAAAHRRLVETARETAPLKVTQQSTV
ncbi:phytanoyl-CoA dioxygenase family protein [Aquihabitans daechungensis]|uniref:phytanoyl-CoA dioxygenase family protein n=1 Tax=Aquihabitans daechungensis TaxID=1052257 RepID=UPI003BA05529